MTGVAEVVGDCGRDLVHTVFRDGVVIGNAEAVEDARSLLVLWVIERSRDHVEMDMWVQRVLGKLNDVRLYAGESVVQSSGGQLEERTKFAGLLVSQIGDGALVFTTDKNQPAFERGAVTVHDVPARRADDAIPERCGAAITTLNQLAGSTGPHHRSLADQNSSTPEAHLIASRQHVPLTNVLGRAFGARPPAYRTAMRVELRAWVGCSAKGR